jgi:uncharacterized membrane protein YdjX (TVP38/TMEM64 family)
LLADNSNPAFSADAEENRSRVSFERRATDALRDMGIWAPIGFLALFVVLCVACVPGVFLTMAAGALFGLGWGFLYAWAGAQLGASAAFFVSRHVAHDWVARRLAKRPLLSAIEEAVTTEGWRIVGLLRLAPGSPFFLLNYLFGLTRVRYREYLLATAVATIPGTLMFVYLGSIGWSAAAGEFDTVWDWVLHGAGLLLIVIACSIVARRSQRILHSRLGPRRQTKAE